MDDDSILGRLRLALRSDGSPQADPHISLGALSDTIGGNGPGLVLLFLGIAMLVPGTAPAFGVAACIVAAGLTLHGNTLWLPQALRRRGLPRKDIEAMLRRLERPLGWIDRHTHRRLPWALEGAWQRLTGLACLSNAILIVLPIPFGNMLPAIALLLSAIGLTAGDGALALLGLVTAVIALAFDAGLVLLGYEAVLHLMGLMS